MQPFAYYIMIIYEFGLLLISKYILLLKLHVSVLY